MYYFIILSLMHAFIHKETWGHIVSLIGFIFYDKYNMAKRDKNAFIIFKYLCHGLSLCKVQGETQDINLDTRTEVEAKKKWYLLAW